MDPRFFITREEFHDVQMDLKRVHTIQQHHSERLRLLEKRQADDAALKSVWNSPFPSVLGGTPQHGPVHANELFSDLEEQSHNLLSSLHLEAEDDHEPARKGAASRANSVRFDVSALHGSNWAGHGGRHSGEFTPIRPGSDLGGHQMMERSLSHKSDGRHSSAGFSVHSAHSGVSGRASSLGLDTNFLIGGHDDDSPIDNPEPPPGFYFLESPPSIIRCWLTTNFTSSNLLYAVVCTGSQRTTVEYSLLKELDLVQSIHRDNGACRIQLPVFLAEARVTHSNSRSASPAPQLPSITASFEVTGMDQDESTDSRKGIRVVIGCHTLRMHSADLLLSQNSMTLYGNDRDKLSVPFVRPEDDSVFKYLTTANLVSGRQKLNAAAPEFVLGESPGKASAQDSKESASSPEPKATTNGRSSEGVLSPASKPSQPAQAAPAKPTTPSESGAESEKRQPKPATPSIPETSGKENNNSFVAAEGNSTPSHPREHNNAAIRTPWRQTALGAIGSGGENGPLSGYQPAARPRNMKVLRPNKSSTTTSSSTSARTGAAYEPAPAPRSSSEYRRKSQGAAAAAADSSSHPPSSNSSGSWGTSLTSGKRSVSSAATTTIGSFGGGGDGAGGSGRSVTSQPETVVKAGGSTASATSSPAVPRTANNPLGSATAFSWIASQSGNKSSASAAAE
ncbi:hypothetical protein V8F20_003748 [Naviculisporaceae sp. PSN 640]